MGENKGTNVGVTVFSFLSFKMKLIIIGIIVGIFILVIVPVIVISSLFSNDNNSNSQQKIGKTQIISNESLIKYLNAQMIMPFETWNSTKDVVTSLFGPRTSPITGLANFHTGIDLVVVSITEPKVCAVLDGKVIFTKTSNYSYR
ncbi:MAG: hypothetical protein Q4G09_07925 [Clostridia bacterium]|nr:hypothetical protein [Clostridia bacterium]